MKTIKEFELEALKMVKKLLNAYMENFRAIGLSTSLIGPKCSQSKKESYESEIEIDFLDNDRIIDVIEFHLFLNGQQMASLSGIEIWLC